MLTVIQVAKLLTLSERSVRRLLDSGKMGYHRFGGAIRIDPAEVEAFKGRTLWRYAGPSEADTPSSSRARDIVFSDGSRPARLKARPKRSSSSSDAK